MNDSPLTEAIVWEQCRPLFDLLLTSLLVLVAVQLVVMAVVVCCLCRETTRASREKAAIDGRSSPEAGRPKDPRRAGAHCLTA